jgi:hypothetical protein
VQAPWLKRIDTEDVFIYEGMVLREMESLEEPIIEALNIGGRCKNKRDIGIFRTIQVNLE